MATTYSFISQIITDVLELDLADQYVTDQWRPWILRETKRRLGMILAAAEWPWAGAVITGIASVAGEAEVDITAKFVTQGKPPFGRLGIYGRVYATASGASTSSQLHPVDHPEGQGIDYTQDAQGEARGFSIVQREGNIYLVLVPSMEAGETYDLYYHMGVPTLADTAPTTPTPPAVPVVAPGGLEFIPDSIVDSLLFPFVAYATYRKVREAELAVEAKDEYGKNLAMEVANAQASMQIDPNKQYGDHGIPEEGMW